MEGFRDEAIPLFHFGAAQAFALTRRLTLLHTAGAFPIGAAPAWDAMPCQANDSAAVVASPRSEEFIPPAAENAPDPWARKRGINSALRLVAAAPHCEISK